MRSRVGTIALATALLLAGCGLEDGTDAQPEPTAVVLGAVEFAPTTTAPTPSTTAAPPVTVAGANEVAFVAAVDDASFPESEVTEASGVYGFSRYVWTETASGKIAPLLVEGPRGAQFRCQDPSEPCSYGELKALAESDEPVPASLGMARDELGQLVSQLDQLNSRLDSVTSIEQACAEGFRVETEQNANMGIHMSNPALIGDGFDPAQPEMLLFAKEGGELIPRAEQGTCTDDGRWTGDPGYQVVGAAYLQPITPEHPEGFAGPIDNWHIHYSSCSGASSDSIQGDQESCIEAGGVWFDRTPVWMMHAYAADGFDSQEGVFAMYNGSIWPLGEDLTLNGSRADADASAVQIVGFDYGTIEINARENITFSNADSLPHTVTATEGDFDSGLLGPGGSYTTSFDSPGEYAIYCVLHPQMTATVVVE
ncbi:MAG: hypothetical protein HKN26_05660 [Acidimicrobiales bacterium]|nr:hypothetical protein [Acidimicrobiales bacterium]